ncbi:hypothetical protein I552_0528 [Mycobacterium xenopi 3993]|nr:hypothetical protein I552_0528 [Mycobacterium xenopi 3993]
MGQAEPGETAGVSVAVFGGGLRGLWRGRVLAARRRGGLDVDGVSAGSVGGRSR